MVNRLVKVVDKKVNRIHVLYGIVGFVIVQKKGVTKDILVVYNVVEVSIHTLNIGQLNELV